MGSLKRRALTSSVFIAASQFLVLALRLVSTLIMTRLLAPDAFGVVALATVVQTIVSMLSDVGINQAVIQSKDGASPRMLNTAWVLQIARGALIYLACALFAVSIYYAQQQGMVVATSTYANPLLPMVVAVASLSSLILGFQSTKVIVAGRSVSYSGVTVIEVVSQVLALLFMASIGYLTRSIWALVSGGIVAAVVRVALTHIYLAGPSNSFSFDMPSAREIFRFGRWVFFASGIYVLASQGDRLLIGAWFDATVLGMYSIAFALATLVDGTSTRIFASVGLSALSEIARDSPERFRKSFYRMRLPFDTGLLLVSGLGFACGHIIVDILYDARYRDAGAMLEVLFLMLVVTRMALCGHAYMALGHPKYLLPINILKTTSLYALVPLAYHHFGIQGAVWAVALHELPLIPLLLFLNWRLGMLNLRFELAVLMAWPAGYLLGLGVDRIWSAWML